jgi:hypothetical protein
MVGVAFEISENPIAVFAADAVEKCMQMSAQHVILPISLSEECCAAFPATSSKVV